MNGLRKRGISKIFAGKDPVAIDLLRKLLIFNPDDRLTVEEVLEHEYLKDFHKISDEITCGKKINLKIDDNDKLSLKVYRDAIYENISDKIKEHSRQSQ